MRRRVIRALFGLTIVLAPAAALLIGFSSASAAGYAFSTLDCSGAASTSANGINDLGEIVGSCGGQGFLRETDGTVTLFSVPGSFNTGATGINHAGQIVGFYDDATGRHGFLFDGGTFTAIDPPGAANSTAGAINNIGQIVGRYSFDCCTNHGFLWDTGSFTMIDVAFAGATQTAAAGINDAGQIVGLWTSGCCENRGFLFSNNQFTDFVVPAATFTAVAGINNLGQAVGLYVSSGQVHGFLLNDGTVVTIDHPNAGPQTSASGVNDAGVIVGNYVDAHGHQHGFMATPADTAPPVTTATPSPAIPNGTNGWYITNVVVTLTASDNPGGSGVKEIHYSLSGAQGGSAVVPGSTASVTISAEGSTTVTYFAVDNAGNQEAAKTVTIQIDKTSPTLVLPANITVDATSPAGAVVSYVATATDNFTPNPPVTCTPASGSTFPIATTSVSCAATDAAGNTTKGSFSILVQGAAAQVADLTATVLSFNLAKGITNSLDAKLAAVSSALDAARAGSLPSECGQLDAFINQTTAQSGNQLTVDEASQLITSAARIKAVIGCP